MVDPGRLDGDRRVLEMCPAVRPDLATVGAATKSGNLYPGLGIQQYLHRPHQIVVHLRDHGLRGGPAQTIEILLESLGRTMLEWVGQHITPGRLPEHPEFERGETPPPQRRHARFPPFCLTRR